ncbi:tellurium resistance protein [Acinetobacter sp. ANC 4558]|uniref:tellurium resistance protein n=1 Tax=Acinetobacter sp. ANC 4558 TaxID=1977876 RepID=UPI000A3490EA|nr:tellurium resistance protein [Acinetobacter sp. ANC 4558]OTG80076.1 tellurium resistance protein [Acinetobacter sp. ANC 4558]
MIVLTPVKEICVDHRRLLQIQRDYLLPILNDQYQLNHYADDIIQAQAKLLKGVDPSLMYQLGQTIEKMIEMLSNANKHLKIKKFNALQRWLGLDIEYDASQIEYYKKLDLLLAKANQLSQRLRFEIQKSKNNIEKIHQYREDMAHAIAAAEGFLQEYPKFVKNIHPLDNFSDRLSKKVMSLMTLQANNDIAITQMQLSQQIALTLLDRFKEAQQVLIPAWQFHVKQSQQTSSGIDLEKLDDTRLNLISSLKNSLDKTR